MVYGGRRVPDFRLYPRTGYPPTFRRSPAHPIRPTRGGRWSIRKDPGRTLTKHAKPWRATSSGYARGYNHYFATHHQAITWATYIARCYHFGEEPRISYKEFVLHLDTWAPEA